MFRETLSGSSSLNNAEKKPRSSEVTIIDRVWLDSTSEGDKSSFVQRLSGFFVPPRTSLYTFNVRSDDLSRVYLSNNISREGLTRIISVSRYTQRCVLQELVSLFLYCCKHCHLGLITIFVGNA